MTEALSTAVETAFSKVSTDIMSMIGVALPIALGVVGCSMAIHVGIKFFKGVTKA